MLECESAIPVRNRVQLPSPVAIGRIDDQLFEHGLYDPVQQRRLVCRMPVESHRISIERFPQPPHGKAFGAFLVDDRQCRRKHERPGERFLAVRDDGADPATLLEERSDRWLAGSVEEVAARIEQLREIGVTRVFLQHLNHDDAELVALAGERLLPAVA